jgi:hypothetical protein
MTWFVTAAFLMHALIAVVGISSDEDVLIVVF